MIRKKRICVFTVNEDDGRKNTDAFKFTESKIYDQ